MAVTIAAFDHKGGAGKTTLVVNLARAFGQLGWAHSSRNIRDQG